MAKTYPEFLEKTFVAPADLMLIWDTAAGRLKKITKTNFTGLNKVLTITEMKAVSTIGETNLGFFIREADGGLRVWSLVAGTALEDLVAGIARPNDYAAASNEKNFIREI